MKHTGMPRRKSGLKPKVIRQLKAGEAIPGSLPRRYIAGHGYVRLRWRVGKGEYVEVYEHRVVDGHVTTAEQVHHKNRNRGDNRAENLEHLTAEEHQAEHHREEQERATRLVERYGQGRSIPRIAREFGIDSSAVYRRLAAAGVQMRKKADYAKPIDEAEVIRMYVAGRGYAAISRELGVSTERIRRLIKAAGVPLRGVGRVKGVKGNVSRIGERKGRQLVYTRSGGECETQIPGVCLGHATNWHHRKARSQGGKWSAPNGLHVCGSGSHGCHGELTNSNGHRAKYEAMGWIVRGRRDPADVPVKLADGWFLLTNVGTRTPTTAPQAVGHAVPVDALGEAS